MDELGYVPFSKIGAQLLVEVIGRAYEQQSLMVATNLPFEQWTEVFGSERLTDALLDRMTHRRHIIEANGESYRLRQAKKRSKNSKKDKNTNSRIKLIDITKTDRISLKQVPRFYSSNRLEFTPPFTVGLNRGNGGDPLD